MKKMTIMIKPASSACNLNCSYCFYKDEASLRKIAVHPFLKKEIIDISLEKIFENTTEEVDFVFQGGEPSLVGLEWFEDFIKLEKKYNKNDIKIEHSFQTNGTGIDENWIKFFRDQKFLVGISFDGTRQIQNFQRPTLTGEKSSKLVIDGMKLLKENDIDFNILTVVTNTVAENLDSVWNFLSRQTCNYYQFIPCIDPLEGEVNRFLSPKIYGEFLIKLFDKWYSALKGNSISIRLFDNFLNILLNNEPESCDMLGHCSIQYVMEGDGSIYPCDFYCLDNMYLGNIRKNSIEELDQTRKQIQFIENSFNNSDECKNCDYFTLCRGGCKRFRDKEGHFRFCESYKMLFDNRIRRFMEIANFIRKQQKKTLR
ncbi:MAG: SPASM domain-containing protein [Sphaerochaetaceae bacterium]|nr:SPASM domain-containing protein [Sphaerochaetaceae bacterium]